MSILNKVIIINKGTETHICNSVPCASKVTGVSVSAIFKANIKGAGQIIKGWSFVSRPILRLKDLQS